jgi:hypothetical protein
MPDARATAPRRLASAPCSGDTPARWPTPRPSTLDGRRCRRTRERPVTEAALVMTDPVSWLQIGQGWNVITADGVVVGTVAQVEGDKQSDIFDGWRLSRSSRPRSVTCGRAGRGDLSRRGDLEDRVRGHRWARAVSPTASRDEVASGEGASHDSDVELAARASDRGSSAPSRQPSGAIPHAGPADAPVVIRSSS